jgi:alkyl hydroperoxide reductase subunit AhpC
LYKDFQEANIGLVFACVDDKPASQALVDKLGLAMPYAYGLDAEATSKALGCYYEPKDKYIHSTGFVIDPEKKLYVSSYSTGVVGRIRADFAYSVIRYYQTEDTGFLPKS